jgi:hypothetical protein
VAGWLRVGQTGAVEIDPATQERLAGKGLALLDGPGGLLLGVNDHTQAPFASKASLIGDLAQIAFPEIVSLIAQARLTGLLAVVSTSAMRAVVFDEGAVRGAASERVGERLIDVIVRMGLVKSHDMDAVRAEAGVGRRAGRLAVERKLLSERDLWNAVQEHVTTIFQAVLLDSVGSFVLANETLDDVLTVPGLSAEGLLMEAVRRLDEQRVRGGEAGAAPDRVLSAYAEAFRDIFATAHDAGAGDAMRRAATSVFEDDPAHAAVFEGIGFGADGQLPESQLLAQARAAAGQSSLAVEELLSDALSTVLLFLLFAAGEHVDADVHQSLHARVKKTVSRD